MNNQDDLGCKRRIAPPASPFKVARSHSVQIQGSIKCNKHKSTAHKQSFINYLYWEITFILADEISPHVFHALGNPGARSSCL